MRIESDNFPLVIIGAVSGLALAIHSIYEDLLKSLLARNLGRWFGLGEAEVMSRIAEMALPLSAAAGIVWFMYRYMDRELKRRNLMLVRELPLVEGDFGFYTAHIKAKNTSLTEKLRDCRCEIAELQDADGLVLQTNIGLRTRGQENKQNQGRFNLDQDATKEVPVFEIDQSKNDGLTIVNANGWDLRFDHGIYTARIRGYGDRGEPDEITVRIDSRSAHFEVIPSGVLSAGRSESARSLFNRTHNHIDLPVARLRLAQLRASGVELRNAGQSLERSAADFVAWASAIDAWMGDAIAAIQVVDKADAEWFRILDAVPEPRVPLYFPAKHNEGAHIKKFREHDYRLFRLEKLIEKYGSSPIQ